MNTIIKTPPLSSLHFDNKFVRELPGDPETDNYRRQVSNACYSSVKPTPVASPNLGAYSPEVSEILDLTKEECESNLFTEAFSGNKLLDQMDPYAMCYGGHQFGRWAGQLGDGRAINLGEVLNKEGQRWILQLKGAGPTPYSRQADGLAVMRSSIREFLCSEAMHHLGVPTTRALSLIATGEEVLRDMFYNGNPKMEPGAVVCRVSPSFIRFGNFEILAARNEIELLQQLMDYTITTDFPHLGAPSSSTYLKWFSEICTTTADLILHWMRVGFVHGVMNTDNMSILGLTIDYGPYGWLEGYEAAWTPNTTDAQGRRYSYSNQPHIGQWNLLQLANAIDPVIRHKEPLQEALSLYNDRFQKGWNVMMAEKIGLKQFVPETDDGLVGELIEILQLVETDMTIFFRNLANTDSISDPDNPLGNLRDAYYFPEDLSETYRKRITHWLQNYLSRIKNDNRPSQERQAAMNKVNPKYVLRNYMAQLAIDKAEKGDYSLMGELLDVMRKPYDEHPQYNNYFAKRPEWARNRAGCSMLSCSS